MFFKGKSKSYVFYSVGDFVEDYGDDFKDTLTFADMLLEILLIETKDKVWVNKISKILSKKLDITDKLRDKPLFDDDDWNKEYKKVIKQDKEE